MELLRPRHYNDVNDWLSVGGDLDLARDVTGKEYEETIHNYLLHGVTHVLDVRSEWEDKREWVAGGLRASHYCHAPVIDSWNHTPSETWAAEVEAFVADFWLNSAHGDRLLIHCHMGINRAPSAAMIALLTVDPEMTPQESFLRIRGARPQAGLVYAKAVGIRHLFNQLGIEDFTADDELPAEVVEWSRWLNSYWTPNLHEDVRRGIAYYRDASGGTYEVDTLNLS